LKDWCQKQGYSLQSWNPRKEHLADHISNLAPDILNQLKAKKVETRRNYGVIFLCPWYRQQPNLEDKIILVKRKTHEAFTAPIHHGELAYYELVDVTSKVKMPWQTIKQWCKHHDKENGGYKYVDRTYMEEEMLVD